VTIAVGNFLFRYRNGLFPLTFALLLLPGPRLFANPLVAAAVGAIVALAGQLIRVTTIGLRYIVRGGRRGRIYADDMVTEGVYGLCRNPIYVGNLFIAVGVALASNSVITLLLSVALAVFAYVMIVAAEEHYLRGKFGAAFDAYCRDVPRWWPRFDAARHALTGGTFHWRRVIVKEYGTPAAWIGVLCGITLYRLWEGGSWHSRPATVRAIAAIATATLLLWATARVLKKSHALKAD